MRAGVSPLLLGALALAACGGLLAPSDASTDGASPADAAGVTTTADATTTDAGLDAPTSAAEGGHEDTSPPPLAGTVSIVRKGGTPISPFAFGQNYWDWVDWAGDGVTGVTGTEPLVKALDLDVIRAGGANNDMNGPPPASFTPAQIDAFVAYSRAIGAEPILQVPVVADPDGGVATAENAASMVTYANVTKGYGIKYWEIGNEPDLYASTYDGGVPLTPEDFCTLYQTDVAAMKAANAAAPGGGVVMTFLGPELAYQYTPGVDFLTPFLDACKVDVDVVSIHRYPFSGMQTSPEGALDDVSAFRDTVASVSAIVSAHARPGTPLAITEANISYDYLVGNYTPATLAAAPTTFYAGMWTADVLGAALESHLWTMAFWDIGDRSTAPSVLGFLQDGRPVPAYYTQRMISGAFRGSTVVPSGVPVGFSAYVSYDAAAGSTAIVVLNKTAAAKSLAIAVDTLAVQSFAFPALSVTLVQIPDAAGALTHVVQYTQAQADAGTGPVTIQ
jgi:hypothetical protein